MILLVAAVVAHTAFLPDARLTPGKTSDITTAQLCDKSFHTETVRNVTAAMKRKVYQSYNLIPNKAPCPCEVDHLIPLELGGANDLTNLWPQPRTTDKFNAWVKDVLENKTHKLVCTGKMTLQDAQHAMSSDWVELYNHVMSKSEKLYARKFELKKRARPSKTRLLRRVGKARRR